MPWIDYHWDKETNGNERIRSNVLVMFIVSRWSKIRGSLKYGAFCRNKMQLVSRIILKYKYPIIKGSIIFSNELFPFGYK